MSDYYDYLNKAISDHLEKCEKDADFRAIVLKITKDVIGQALLDKVIEKDEDIIKLSTISIRFQHERNFYSNILGVNNVR